MAKVKITETELRQLVRESLKKRFEKAPLNESLALSAKRKLTLSAKEHTMDFEKKIVDTLGLTDPDELSEELQRQYIDIVEEMQNRVVSAVQEAVAKLATFPRADGAQAKTVSATPARSSIPRATATIPKVKL